MIVKRPLSEIQAWLDRAYAEREEEPPAPRVKMLPWGQTRIIRVDGTDVYLDVAHPRFAEEMGWEPLSGGYTSLPEDLKPLLTLARVYRHTDGTDMLASVEAEVGELPSRVPLSGKSSADPPDPDQARRGLDVAQERWRTQDPDAPETVARRRIPMDAVLDSDVVDEDLIPACGWAGRPRGEDR